ncbi:glycoside hydrolase family 88 protein [Bifidobacterium sp. UBA744]|uniref:glycoside hydrolase family 88 protein n=1 Tax=Bifidobacterium sp. UBA744 TaxID=1946112 RepID=UPI0025B87054|nr:glycoside hydrolase family 88 protein [Bifidobacterium sp. UBA744]
MGASISDQLTPEDARWAAEIAAKLETKFAAERDREGSKIPYIAESGRYEEDMAETFPGWWTNGFWPGILWQMFAATGEESYSEPARRIERTTLDGVISAYEKLDHDVGFLWLLSAVADWRLTHNESSRVRGLHVATVLAGRFNPAGRFIRAWNELGREGWAIVDSMMNIPLLFWASEETGDPRFAEIARQHADTMLANVVRPDGSCNHIVCFDPLTGEFQEAPAGQGYAAGSSWSRGQSWGIFGFARAYRHTGDERYLDAAKRVAHYFCSQVALTGGIALIDFRQPAEPKLFDAIASCVAADGLIELAELVPEAERGFYRSWALLILHAVTEKACDFDPGHDGVVQLCSDKYHDGRIHVPIIYADYFLLESILRLQGRAADLW